MFKKTDKTIVLLIVFLIFFIVIIIRLAYLQIAAHKFFKKLSLDQRVRVVELFPDRGDIYDRSGNILATSIDKWSIYVRPRAIGNKKEIISALAAIFPGEKELIRDRFAKSVNFWLKRKTEKEFADKAASLECTGIDISKEKKRIYPNGRLASQLIGFAGLDNQGLSGIELGLDQYLKGTSGKYVFERDLIGREIVTGNSKEIQPPTEGMNVYLTIDETIQYVAASELETALKKSGAAAGSIIVADIKTGDILAIAGWPDFDPNHPASSPDSYWKLSPITNIYEPGSTFKIITASAGIEEHIADLDTKFDCPEIIRIGGRTIKNSHRVLRDTPFKTLRDVIAESLNTGVAPIGIKLGAHAFYKNIRKFGFGSYSGLDFPGEQPGIVKKPQDWYKSDVATMTFGQTIAVTPLQLVSAIAAIANGGIRIKQKIVKKVESPDKDIIRQGFSQTQERVISKRTADKVTELMKGVVYMKHGTGHLAKMDKFSVAAKTGTAQKPAPGGGYMQGRYVASIVGFVPASKPRIAMLVIFDDPKTSIWGAVLAAPVFKKVGEFALRYLNVSPDS